MRDWKDAQMGTTKGPLVRGTSEAIGLDKELTKSHPPPIFVNEV